MYVYIDGHLRGCGRLALTMLRFSVSLTSAFFTAQRLLFCNNNFFFKQRNSFNLNFTIGREECFDLILACAAARPVAS